MHPMGVRTGNAKGTKKALSLKLVKCSLQSWFVLRRSNEILLKQKSEGNTCNNTYECKNSHFCFNSKCTEVGSIKNNALVSVDEFTNSLGLVSTLPFLKLTQPLLSVLHPKPREDQELSAVLTVTAFLLMAKKEVVCADLAGSHTVNCTKMMIVYMSKLLKELA